MDGRARVPAGVALLRDVKLPIDEQVDEQAGEHPDVDG